MNGQGARAPVYARARGRVKAAFLALLCLLAGPPARADETVHVQKVVEGDKLELADGRKVRLVGVNAPGLYDWNPARAAEPYAAESRALLAVLVEGRDVRLVPAATPSDRHGRVLAQLYLPDGAWVQGELLKAGAVRVYSFADNRAAIAGMLPLEAAARAAGQGLWALPAYRVRAAGEDMTGLTGFQLVEGVVRGAQKKGSRIYLNFGDDWRTDFTASIPRAHWRDFDTFDPETLAGRRVRVRGWLEAVNGPSISLTHPEQLEILEDTP